MHCFRLRHVVNALPAQLIKLCRQSTFDRHARGSGKSAGVDGEGEGGGGNMGGVVGVVGGGGEGGGGEMSVASVHCRSMFPPVQY